MHSRILILALLAPFAINPAAVDAQVMSVAPLRGAKSETDKSVRAMVFIDGNVKGAAEGKQTSVASGVLGISLESENWDMSASLNVAAKRDTIRQSPGQSLLVPGSGGFSAGIVEGRYWPTASRVRPRAYASVSSLLWDMRATPESDPNVAVANAVGMGLGVSWQIADGMVGEGEDKMRVGVRIDGGLTQRLLYGDVMDPRLESARDAFLGTNSRRFSGYEIGAQLQYGPIRGSLVYYNFPRAKGVPGLTKGQVTAGFAIAAPVRQGELKKR